VSLVLMVQFSLPYNNAGRADVFHKFILVFLKVLCSPNILFINYVVFKYSINLLSTSTPCLKDTLGQTLK
jgi:hypothetical protein